MRRFPSISDICIAMTNPRSCLYDRELALGTVEKDKLGQARGISGGFAVVFKLKSVSGKKYAVRIFHRDSPNRDFRYKIISSKLKALNLTYFLPFEYQERGVVVNGETFPIIKMEWLDDGEDLTAFISSHLQKQESLQNLRVNLMRLHLDLRVNCIAHGDIQPENIRIFGNGTRIRLLDYDGLYCRELANLGPAELGCPNFQHPQRAVDKFWDVGLDDFSFLTLDISLRILLANPKMWGITGSNSGEKIIFSKDDYEDTILSRAFLLSERLSGCSDFVMAFAEICRGSITDVPSSPAVLTTKLLNPSIIPTSGNPQRNSGIHARRTTTNLVSKKRNVVLNKANKKAKHNVHMPVQIHPERDNSISSNCTWTAKEEAKERRKKILSTMSIVMLCVCMASLGYFAPLVYHKLNDRIGETFSNLIKSNCIDNVACLSRNDTQGVEQYSFASKSNQQSDGVNCLQCGVRLDIGDTIANKFSLCCPGCGCQMIVERQN